MVYIALIAPILKRAETIAREIAIANTDHKMFLDTSRQTVTFADGTHIWYGAADNIDRWRGCWCDQIFICDDAKVSDELRAMILHRTCVPDEFVEQYI